MADPLEAFVAALDTKAFKVVAPPPLIFLCGGKFGGDGDPPLSLRQIFFDFLSASSPQLVPRVLLAEEAMRWYRSAQFYPNLLDFEEHIASLCGLILLFVESPGSIAELGAFAEGRAFRNKVVAVVEEAHYDGPSFIRDGPIELLLKLRQSAVRVFPWVDQQGINFGLCSEAASEIREGLEGDIEERRGDGAFKLEDDGHRMLLIADLAALAGAIREGELLAMLIGWGVEVTKEVLDRYLFLLANVGFVKVVKYDRTIYAVRASEDPEFIAFPRMIDGRATDRMRLGDLLRAALPWDRNRTRAYKRAMKGDQLNG